MASYQEIPVEVVGVAIGAVGLHTALLINCVSVSSKSLGIITFPVKRPSVSGSEDPKPTATIFAPVSWAILIEFTTSS